MASVTFISPDGSTEWVIDAEVGKSLMEIARENDIDIEGACEGIMACSTCHVLVEPDFLAWLKKPSEDERDMLDLTANLTRSSRLGCQIRMTEELSGLRVRLPKESHNMLLSIV